MFGKGDNLKKMKEGFGKINQLLGKTLELKKNGKRC